jgi:hypothetical protein
MLSMISNRKESGFSDFLFDPRRGSNISNQSNFFWDDFRKKSIFEP